MIGDLANHVWQSTVFALAVGLLALLVRDNRARVRHWLWLAASVKFLVPFALLGSLGSHVVEWAPGAHSGMSPTVAVTVAQINEPFSNEMVSGTTSSIAGESVERRSAWSVVLLITWGLGVAAIAFMRFQLWRRIRRLVLTSVPIELANVDLPSTLDVRSTAGMLEPGVIGIFRPILLLPAGIEDYLSPRQLQAVVAHELCHVRSRDNLTASVHMFVEAVFWFHPLVWWIGGRLVEARERACDENVLRELADPNVYAQSILNVCKRYVRSPLVCASGVSGADLKARLEAIVENRIGHRLTLTKRFALVVAGVLSISLPVTIGAIASAQSPIGGGVVAQNSVTSLPQFDVVSVRRNVSGEDLVSVQLQPGGRYTATNVFVRELIRLAYGLQEFQLTGGPDWITSERYDVSAKAPDATPPTRDTINLFVQRLLYDRFNLRVHPEFREFPTYNLIVGRPDGRLGPRIMRSSLQCAPVRGQAVQAVTSSPPPPPPPPASAGNPCGTNVGFGRITAGRRTMAQLARTLGERVGRIVVDQTGLSGEYDFQIDFTPDNAPNIPIEALPNGVPLPAADGPPLMTALEEQLGLKLVPVRSRVEVLVIDSVERPTPN